MKRQQALVFIASVFFMGLAQAQTPYFAWAASKLYPDVEWHVETAVSADLDCNGKSDLAMLGTGRNADDSHLEVIIFHNGRIDQHQASGFHSSRLNPKTAQLELIESDITDANFRESIGETPEGYRRSKTCKTLAIDDGQSDRIYIYWNWKTRQFSGWSL